MFLDDSCERVIGVDSQELWQCCNKGLYLFIGQVSSLLQTVSTQSLLRSLKKADEKPMGLVFGLNLPQCLGVVLH